MEARTEINGEGAAAQTVTGTKETGEGEDVMDELGDVWLTNLDGVTFNVGTGGSRVAIVARRSRPPRLLFSWEYDAEAVDG